MINNIAEISNRQLEIIEAAGRLLTSSGVHGLTIKNLANEMKFSESAIYRHFKSKEDIIVAMLNYLAESAENRLKKVSKSEDASDLIFRKLFKSQFEFFDKHPHFVVAVFSDGLMDESSKINEAIYNLIGIKMKYLIPILFEGQQKGLFTNIITTEELMNIVMGAFRLQMFRWRLANFQYDINVAGENMINSILALILTK